MKRLLLLYPLYILFLSGLPCSPYDGCCQEELQITASAGHTAGEKDNTKSQKSELPCSPFFPCGACHGVVIPNDGIQVVQPVPTTAKLSSHYSKRPLLAFSSTIWQPPKKA